MENHELKYLKNKVSALSHLAYGNLESAENHLESKWVQENDMTMRYLEEHQQDLYVLATIISDIEKDLERLAEEKKVADGQ